MGAVETVSKEQVVYFEDSKTGLRMITVLDGDASGPTVGACRRRPYDDEERALADAFRQAESTAAKAALAELPIGGGATVLINGPIRCSLEERYRALGRAVDNLKGRYVLMPGNDDMASDMDQVAAMTPHVLGTGAMSVDWVEVTALGVLRGIELAAHRRFGKASLSGLRIAMIGLGPTGYRLAQLLRLRGAKIIVADRDPRRTERAVRELGIACVTTEEIIHLDADVLAPCASRDVINRESLPHLRCGIVAGTADDVLQTPDMGRGLHERGILYLPDFMINAGGMIGLVDSLVCVGANALRVDEQIKAMTERLEAVLDTAAETDRPTSDVAYEYLQTRLLGGEPVLQQTDVALAG